MLTTTGTKPNHLTGRAGIVRCPPCSPKESPAGARKKPNMIDRKTMWKTTSMLLTGVIASSILAFQVRAQSNAPLAHRLHHRHLSQRSRLRERAPRHLGDVFRPIVSRGA